MQQEQFQQIVEARLSRIKDTLITKAAEYARGDRLSNFKKISHLMGVTNEQALSGLVAKHIVALYDFIKDIESGHVMKPEQWDEKIGDIMAYMCLLDAMIQERIGK